LRSELEKFQSWGKKRKRADKQGEKGKGGKETDKDQGKGPLLRGPFLLGKRLEKKKEEKGDKG